MNSLFDNIRSRASAMRLPGSRGLRFILLLVITSLVLQATGVIDIPRILQFLADYSMEWWFIPALILIQAALYTFALAGSYALWIVAPLYTPVIATMILAGGGLLGAVSAYLFSRHLSEEWIQRVEHSRAYRLLNKHNSFFTCFALRIMPGFPHGLLNYSSGMLKTPPVRFVLATFAGFSLKFYIYSSLVHSAASAATHESSVSILDIWPLAVLSLFLLMGIVLRSMLTARSNDA